MIALVQDQRTEERHSKYQTTGFELGKETGSKEKMNNLDHVWGDVRSSIAEQNFRKLGDILLELASFQDLPPFSFAYDIDDFPWRNPDTKEAFFSIIENPVVSWCFQFLNNQAMERAPLAMRDSFLPRISEIIEIEPSFSHLMSYVRESVGQLVYYSLALLICSKFIVYVSDHRTDYYWHERIPIDDLDCDDDVRCLSSYGFGFGWFGGWYFPIQKQIDNGPIEFEDERMLADFRILNQEWAGNVVRVLGCNGEPQDAIVRSCVGKDHEGDVICLCESVHGDRLLWSPDEGVLAVGNSAYIDYMLELTCHIAMGELGL